MPNTTKDGVVVSALELLTAALAVDRVGFKLVQPRFVFLLDHRVALPDLLLSLLKLFEATLLPLLSSRGPRCLALALFLLLQLFPLTRFLLDHSRDPRAFWVALPLVRVALKMVDDVAVSPNAVGGEDLLAAVVAQLWSRCDKTSLKVCDHVLLFHLELFPPRLGLVQPLRSDLVA